MPTNLHTAYTHTESTQIKYTWTLNTHILHNSQNTHDSHTEYIFVIHTIQTYTYTHHTHAQTWYKPTIQYICDAHTSIIHVIQNRQYPNSSHIHNTRCMHAYKTHTDIIQKIHTHIIDTPHVYKMHTLYSCRQTIQNPHKHIKHASKHNTHMHALFTNYAYKTHFCVVQMCLDMFWKTKQKNCTLKGFPLHLYGILLYNPSHGP